MHARASQTTRAAPNASSSRDRISRIIRQICVIVNSPKVQFIRMKRIYGQRHSVRLHRHVFTGVPQTLGGIHTLELPFRKLAGPLLSGNDFPVLNALTRDSCFLLSPFCIMRCYETAVRRSREYYLISTEFDNVHYSTYICMNFIFLCIPWSPFSSSSSRCGV